MSLDRLKSFDRDEMLAMLGLETKPTWSDYLVPALTLFGTGLLVGSAVGLLFAPRPGKELREDLGRRIQQAPEAFARIPERAAELTQRAGEVVGNVRDQVRETANQVATKAEGIGREAQPRADQTRTGGHSA